MIKNVAKFSNTSTFRGRHIRGVYSDKPVLTVPSGPLSEIDVKGERRFTNLNGVALGVSENAPFYTLPFKV